MRIFLIAAILAAAPGRSADPAKPSAPSRDAPADALARVDADLKAGARVSEVMPTLCRIAEEDAEAPTRFMAERRVIGWALGSHRVGPDRWAALADAGEVSRLAASFLACRLGLWGSPFTQHQPCIPLSPENAPITDLEVDRLPHDGALVTLAERADAAAGWRPSGADRNNFKPLFGRLGLWRVVYGEWEISHERIAWERTQRKMWPPTVWIPFNYCADRLEVFGRVRVSKPAPGEPSVGLEETGPDNMGCAVLGEGPNLLNSGRIVLVEGDLRITRAKFENATVLVNGDMEWRPDPDGRPNQLTARSSLIACTGRFDLRGPDGKVMGDPRELLGWKSDRPDGAGGEHGGTVIQNAAPELKGLKFSCPEWYGLSVAARDKLAVVTAVAPGSACDKAGVKPGDAVVKVNGMPVTSPRSVGRLLCRAEVGPGAAVVQVRRGADMHYLLAPLAP